MHITFNLFRDCKYRNRRAKDEVVVPLSYTSFDLHEEYVNAFRTKSYHDFWAEVLDLTLAHGAALNSRGGSAASRLPSCHVFVEHLIEPDQQTIDGVLAHVQKHCHPEAYALLSDFYSETTNASLLCGLLLKDIEQIRHQLRPLKTSLSSLVINTQLRIRSQTMDNQLDNLSQTIKSFDLLASSKCKLRRVRDGSANLLRRLESCRMKVRARLQFLNRIKRALAVSLLVLTVSTSVIGVNIVLHSLIAIVFFPTFLSTSSQLASTRRVNRVLSRLDAATKGMYILNHDLDTISQLVARLQDEMEHMLALVNICCDRGDGRQQLTQEAARLMHKADTSFNQQLDELEDHIYLCFMTINKARCLVMRELLSASKA